MNVTICRENDRIEIQFRNWKENRGRYARIELDMLREVTYFNVLPDPNDSELIRIYRDGDGFSEKDINVITNVLSGYTIHPENKLHEQR